ncbi:MAG: peroxiredoxin [Hydrogenibacillus schlegelii]|uniref:Peroxiredoxin n=1 Tax=Hydrogenibacillus schlegelii TaxID=1484 RepID=A0A947CWV1_HYDSH|nr:peroxiredoxin [Hydrogenibacillus schlegelii]
MEAGQAVLKLGDALPDIALPAYFPETKADGTIHLGPSAPEKRWTILVYYPADFTFVCPTELADFARHHNAFRALGAEVVGVSTDTVYTHKAWLESERLLSEVRFPLAADHNGRLARLLNIYNEADGTALRGTFLVDPDGILRAQEVTWYDVGRNAEETLRLLEAFEFVRNNPGVACPAGWRKGQKYLKPGMELVGKVAEALT